MKFQVEPVWARFMSDKGQRQILAKKLKEQGFEYKLVAGDNKFIVSLLQVGTYGAFREYRRPMGIGGQIILQTLELVTDVNGVRTSYAICNNAGQPRIPYLVDGVRKGLEIASARFGVEGGITVVKAAGTVGTVEVFHYSLEGERASDRLLLSFHNMGNRSWRLEELEGQMRHFRTVAQHALDKLKNPMLDPFINTQVSISEAFQLEAGNSDLALLK
jgi:hypothetical protein